MASAEDDIALDLDNLGIGELSRGSSQDTEYYLLTPRARAAADAASSSSRSLTELRRVEAGGSGGGCAAKQKALQGKAKAVEELARAQAQQRSRLCVFSAATPQKRRAGRESPQKGGDEKGVHGVDCSAKPCSAADVSQDDRSISSPSKANCSSGWKDNLRSGDRGRTWRPILTVPVGPTLRTKARSASCSSARSRSASVRSERSACDGKGSGAAARKPFAEEAKSWSSELRSGGDSVFGSPMSAAASERGRSISSSRSASVHSMRSASSYLTMPDGPSLATAGRSASRRCGVARHAPSRACSRSTSARRSRFATPRSARGPAARPRGETPVSSRRYLDGRPSASPTLAEAAAVFRRPVAAAAHAVPPEEKQQGKQGYVDDVVDKPQTDADPRVHAETDLPPPGEMSHSEALAALERVHAGERRELEALGEASPQAATEASSVARQSRQHRRSHVSPVSADRLSGQSSATLVSPAMDSNAVADLTTYLPADTPVSSPATREAAAAIEQLLSEEKAELDAATARPRWSVSDETLDEKRADATGAGGAAPTRRKLSLDSAAGDEAEQARQRATAEVDKSQATVKEKLFVFGQSCRPAAASGTIAGERLVKDGEKTVAEERPKEGGTGLRSPKYYWREQRKTAGAAEAPPASCLPAAARCMRAGFQVNLVASMDSVADASTRNPAKDSPPSPLDLTP
eukprot:TRINITY_DN4789_c0_g1_i2.p1 TRINITY_DN4789_c0_g1~~TRINITY_DN4789_c0_g1_i2.p1  ORF type:complete len:694 (-),score=165.23 TRINITY_DN4789_c0_g1_i2:316-2397(-)